VSRCTGRGTDGGTLGERTFVLCAECRGTDRGRAQMGALWESVPSYWASEGKGKRGGGVGEQVYRSGHRWGHSGGAYLRIVCRMPRYRWTASRGKQGASMGQAWGKQPGQARGKHGSVCRETTSRFEQQ
jgi:hypothetical protein